MNRTISGVHLLMRMGFLAFRGGACSSLRAAVSRGHTPLGEGAG